MAAKNNEVNEYPETIVIIAEPSFGSAMKFLVLGAALGAGAVLYLKRTGEVAAAPAAAPSPATRNEQLNKRVHALARGVKSLAGKAGVAAKLASKAVTPVIKNAINEGKRAAQATIDEIDEDLESEPDTKFAAEGEKIEAEKEAEAKKYGLDR